MTNMESFMPHGMCYLWRPDMLLLHVVSDLFISLAYFSIPAAMIVLIRNRPDIPRSIFQLFVAFILLCGITHIVSIVVVWEPIYLIHGITKLATAVVSVVTAFLLWPLIPQVIALPSVKDLEQRNTVIESLNTKLLTRLKSLETLAGGVSHGFNNLLAVIQGNVELLAAKEKSPEISKRLQSIEDATRRATDMCRKMLAYSGKGHFMLDELDLANYIQELNPTIPGHIRVAKSFGLDVPRISASHDQIDQLVEILVENSVEAISESADSEPAITFAVFKMHLNQSDLDNAEFEHNAKPGDFVVLEVSDTGAGMSRETQELLFNPYFSTKFTGRGLGMSALQGIVRGHEACLFVKSTLGAGTSIQIAFPAMTERVQHYQPQVSSNPKTILVVDDEESVLEVTASYLQELGIRPITATSATEGLALFREREAEIDAIIIDYLMPERSGVDLLNELGDLTQKDIYLTSGFTRGEIADPDIKSKLTGYIAKPFSLEDLAALLRL